MNKKLIFRILGAVSSALIIVSIFIPFISVSGYSQSLWEAYSNSDTLYLPIMIIVFGVIGTLFFSLNIKTEIAYSTAGALLFYLISETISFIDQDMIKTLSVGYYCLAIGTLLTGVMAFLSNLKIKQPKPEINIQQPENPVTIVTQMDALYSKQEQNLPLQPIPDMIVQSQPVQPIPDMTVQSQPVQPIPDMTVQSQPVQPIPDMIVQSQPVQPIPDMIVQSQPVQPIPDMTMQSQPLQTMENFTNVNLNPVVAEFASNMPAESNNNTQSIVSNGEQNSILGEQKNPVVDEFSKPTNTLMPQAPIKNEPKVDNSNINNLDIFN